MALNKIPKLQVISIGEEEGVSAYANSLIKNGKKDTSIDIHYAPYNGERDGDDIKDFIKELNANMNVSGILGLNNIPESRRDEGIYDVISREKDVDCQTSRNFEAFLRGSEVPFAPATAEAVLQLIEEKGLFFLRKDKNQEELTRAPNIAIVGAGNAVGKPLSELSKRTGFYTDLIETHPDINPNWMNDLKDSKADIIVGAAGHAPHCITSENIPESTQFLIDVAYCDTPTGDTVGNISPDLNIPNIQNHQIGAATTKVMIEHVKIAHERMRIK